MKRPYIILNIAIPGTATPGTDIDVYLQPLIAELKTLWGVRGEHLWCFQS